MSVEHHLSQLPAYQTFIDTISVLDLPISGSELHGLMCGYLCAGAASEGETYLRALTTHKKGELFRAAVLTLFEVYNLTQQQLINFDFEFQLLLPDDNQPLIDRAQAFSEWCEGFTQGMTVSGVGYAQLHEEESQEALRHLLEFAQLEYETLQVDEEDEKALFEVSEYTRMTVLRLYGDLVSTNSGHGKAKTKH